MPGFEVLLYGLPLAFLAGFIDAIAGGGGVITLPTLLMMGLSPGQAVATALAFTLVIGLYDGFVGPGTGTFLVFCFVSLLGFDFVTGTGNAKVINLATNLAAVALFLFTGQMIFWLGLAMGVANAAGAYLGARMAMLRGSAFVKVIYVGIVLAVAARLVLVR